MNRALGTYKIVTKDQISVLLVSQMERTEGRDIKEIIPEKIPYFKNDMNLQIQEPSISPSQQLIELLGRISARIYNSTAPFNQQDKIDIYRPLYPTKGEYILFSSARGMNIYQDRPYPKSKQILTNLK